MEEVEEQSLTDSTAPYTIFPDARRDEWATKILPKLKVRPLRELMERTGLPRSTLQAIRAGRRPHAKRAKLLAAIAVQAKRDEAPPSREVAAEPYADVASQIEALKRIKNRFGR